MNFHRLNVLKSGLVAALALTSFGSTAFATTTYNIDFNNKSALAAMPSAPITFATSPWYQVNTRSAAAPVIFTTQDNSNYGHFHVSFEDPCWNCIAGNSFGYDKRCLVNPPASTPACDPLDTTAAPRYIQPHIGTQSIITSARSYNPFSASWSTGVFNVKTFQLRTTGAPIVICFGAAPPSTDVLCTGAVSAAGTYSLSTGPVTWVSFQGISTNIWGVDNVVISY